MRGRLYGTAGDWVVVVHGGPGVAGYMAPVARRLADFFRVLEPFQRASGPEPLTVARHIEDLQELIESHCAPSRPALIGHSWGAMLALAYAAAHPDSARSVVLVACGTFDSAARKVMQANINRRMDDQLRRHIESLAEEVPDPNERLRLMGKLLLPLYSYEPFTDSLEEVEMPDFGAYQETWSDMVRLQEEGVYPAAFTSVKVPVLMLHGAADPHPGKMIHDTLEPHVTGLQYHELDRCGHYPWLEKAAAAEFFSVLHEWLLNQQHAGGKL